ncbi:MAG: RDD family protein [Dehalococcoidia bacterium]|nr:RDD family protein [Dehalococcoidia bacterium]
MKCSNCAADIAAGQRFCPSCGSPVPVAQYCSNCGAELQEGSAFCANCGTPRAGANPPSTPAPASAPQAAAAPGPQAPPQPAAPVERFKYQGVWSRLAAAIIDGILLVALAWAVAMQIGITVPTSDGFGFELTGLPAYIAMAIWAAYFILFEAYLKGTIGKLILGMRLVNANGGRVGLVASLVRNILRVIDFLPAFYILGIILVGTSKEKQRLGDRVAGTYVVARGFV